MLATARAFPPTGIAPFPGRNPSKAQFVGPSGTNWRSVMLKGGLLWLIGIPLPIILILYFLGYLS
jgi:hypothetical protein